MIYWCNEDRERLKFNSQKSGIEFYFFRFLTIRATAIIVMSVGKITNNGSYGIAGEGLGVGVSWFVGEPEGKGLELIVGVGEIAVLDKQLFILQRILTYRVCFSISFILTKIQHLEPKMPW